jgi:hypothetical protein
MELMTRGRVTCKCDLHRTWRRTLVKTPIFALAAGLIAMSASAASAFPDAKSGINAAPVAEQVVVRDGNNNYGMKKRPTRNRMVHRDHNDNDERYQQYNGWHRYNHRPSRWSNRGCVAIGPIWFCP